MEDYTNIIPSREVVSVTLPLVCKSGIVLVMVLSSRWVLGYPSSVVFETPTL